MAFTIEQLQPFHEKLASRHTGFSLEKDIASVVDYLTTGQANALAGIAAG